MGRYNSNNESHDNRHHYEEISLDSNNSFQYFSRIEFGRYNTSGIWRIIGDTLLLTEEHPCFKEKIKVKEEHDAAVPKGTIRFSVTSLNGNLIDYNLVLTAKNKVKTESSRNGTIEIKVSHLYKFYFIVNSTLFSPEYVVQSDRSNHFVVQIADQRFIFNEKWIVRNGNIIPIGWDNKYVNYHLRKVK
ncbi:hypothetical protein BH09BAC3_BH09BAC3_28480 [soil metagenome]